jgi:spectinomycin phosphotransferase
LNDLPDELDVDALPGVLRDGWGIDIATIEYAPVGFGSYHWIATDMAGTRLFVTVDDLDRKPWSGDSRVSAFDGLKRSFGTARMLRDAGLEFVLAPIPGLDHDAIRRVDQRYTVAVFPFAHGESSRFGEHRTPERRAAVFEMLARLHRATSVVASIVPRPGLDLPGRSQLEAALRAIDEPWTGGPYGELARTALLRRAGDVADLLGLYDRLARDVEAQTTDWVVTHGEPHAANVIWTDAGPLLIDWDTVALAPPERDLWQVGDGRNDATVYACATGHVPDPVALDFYRLTWDLAEVAGYVDLLRAPHRESDDMRKSYENLLKDLATRDRWAHLLPKDQ